MSDWSVIPSGGFEDRVVVVTGAGSGIGRAAAQAFAEAGAYVVIGGRTENRLGQTRALCPDPERVVAVACDVAVEADVERLMDTAVDRFGGLHAAFNNAGTFGTFGPLHEDDNTNFDDVVNTNLRGVWLCMKHEIARMLPTGGAIVNCASVAGHRGHQRSPLYSATKHAVIGLTKSTALQYARQGIRVNVVSPGSTDTEMLNSLYNDPAQLDARRARAPLGRLGSAAEAAAAAVWLASPAASYVTGQTLIVDGGVTAGTG